MAVASSDSAEVSLAVGQVAAAAAGEVVALRAECLHMDEQLAALTLQMAAVETERTAEQCGPLPRCLVTSCAGSQTSRQPLPACFECAATGPQRIVRHVDEQAAGGAEAAAGRRRDRAQCRAVRPTRKRPVFTNGALPGAGRS